MAHKVKIVVIGNSATGKSSIMQRFVSDTFDENQRATVGVDFRSKQITIDSPSAGPAGSCNAALQIFDTAGQDKLRTLSSSFYRGAHACILVYSVTDPASFENLSGWLAEARNFCPNIVTMLVANKIDLLKKSDDDGEDAAAAAADTDAQVWRQEESTKAEEFARANQMLYVRTSAKTKEGVVHAFEEVARRVIETPEFREKLFGSKDGSSTGDNDASGGGRVDLNNARGGNQHDQGAGLGCC